MSAINIEVRIRAGKKSSDKPEFQFFSEDAALDLCTGDISLPSGEHDLVFELKTQNITWNAGNDVGTHPLSFLLGKASDGYDTCWIWQSKLLWPETKARYSGSQFLDFTLAANSSRTDNTLLRVHAVNSDKSVYKYRLGVGARISPQKIVPLTNDPKIKNTGSGLREKLLALFGIT